MKTKKSKAKSKNRSGEWEFFDDCPVCQAEKRAQAAGRNATMMELKEAFRKAKDQGAIVGGHL